MKPTVLAKGQIVTVINGKYKGASGIVKKVHSEKCLVELNIWGNIIAESIDIKDVEVAEKPSWV